MTVILTGGLIVVDVDPLQLEVRITVVCAGGVNAVLIGDHLPELQPLQNSIDRHVDKSLSNVWHSQIWVLT